MPGEVGTRVQLSLHCPPHSLSHFLEEGGPSKLRGNLHMVWDLFPYPCCWLTLGSCRICQEWAEAQQRPVLVVKADRTGKGQREGIYATNWGRGGARGGTQLPSRVNYTWQLARRQLARILSSGLAVQITECVCVFAQVCACMYIRVHVYIHANTSVPLVVARTVLSLCACVAFSCGFLCMCLYVCVCTGVNLCFRLDVYMLVCVHVREECLYPCIHSHVPVPSHACLCVWPCPWTFRGAQDCGPVCSYCCMESQLSLKIVLFF